MKQIILFFAFISSLSAYCQVNNLEDGNQCFNQGDYICAESKYKEAFKTALGKDKQITEIKIQRAKRCIENLKNANSAFNSKNYSKAKELYLAVLDSNPNDATAKSQLEIITTFLSKPKTTTLSLSKTDISFESSGGTISISVDSNFSSYTIKLLPTWCSITKYDKYFVINCNSYNANTSRKDYFDVNAGDKTIRVNVVQKGTASGKENYLNVSKTNLAFSSRGGYDEVKVTTNSIDFTASWFPSWCIINKYKDYVSITCLSNETNQSRSDWFKLNAGNKEVKIYVYQSGKDEITTIENKQKIEQEQNKKFIESVRLEKLGEDKIYVAFKDLISLGTISDKEFDEIYLKAKKDSKTAKRNQKIPLGPFSSIGFQSGEIAKYGFIYERGGRNTFGFRITARTSLTSENDLLNQIETKNKTEIELGPNIKIFKRLFWNIGVGYGFYNRITNNDYANILTLEKTGYSVATSGLMFRLTRVISINGGASFMDIEKDFYKPEITFGISFNLKRKYSF